MMRSRGNQISITLTGDRDKTALFAEAEAAAALIRIGRGGQTLALTRLIGLVESRDEPKDVETLAGLLSGHDENARFHGR